MSKILVIEPLRMLQHALVVALAPEHEVQLLAGFGKDTKTADFEALIVDAGALEQTGGLNQAVGQWLENTKIPTVLIDGTEPVEVSDRVGLARLKAPLGQDVLKAALRQCLGAAPSSEPKGAETPRSKGTPRRAAPKKPKAEEPSGAPADEPLGVIELTEIVEED